jgi:hypothetical protein
MTASLNRLAVLPEDQKGDQNDPKAGIGISDKIYRTSC